MKAICSAAFAFALATLLPACAHSPESTFFALAARPGNPAPSARALKIELRRTALPSYLDRPHIVRRATAERLELGGDERWAAPLDEMVGATLAEDLSQRLPGCVVYTDSGAISSVPDVRVEIQLFRFERAASGDVELLAEVAVHSGTAGPATMQRFAFATKPPSGRTSDVVTSLSQLLGQLADGVSVMIVRQAGPSSSTSLGNPRPSRSRPIAEKG
jgi:uncharacterized protein